jgi:hypothetical protein
MRMALTVRVCKVCRKRAARTDSTACDACYGLVKDIAGDWLLRKIASLFYDD